MEVNKKLEVLIVEDDIIVSRLHKFVLGGKLQHEVHVFENGRNAVEHLDKYESQKDKFLILLDLNMPKMNGWEFLEVAHAKPYKDKLVIVIVTSSSYKEDSRKAFEYNQVVAYYTKPLKKENIAEILKHPKISEIATVKN